MDNDLQNTNAAMTKVTNGISMLKGLRVSALFLLILLAASQIYMIVMRFKLYSPLYILLLVLFFPMIMEGILNSKGATDESGLPLPMLRKKYKFTFSKTKAHSYSFLLNIVLLIAWHYNFTVRPPEIEILRSFPSGILFGYVAVRLVVWIAYLLIFKFAPARLMK